MGGSYVFVRECETKECLIYRYRFGKNPARSGKGKNMVQMASLRSKKQAVSKGNHVCFERTTAGQG
jgi:hypothetical protein